MSSAFIAIGVFICFALGYKFYASRIEKNFDVAPQRKTPAYTKYDGIDFVPARHWTILFGHHFSSIAGAAPIIGPIIAVSIWGWGVSVLWIVLGCIFLGAVHDFGALMTSIHFEGATIADIVKDTISHKAKLVFSIFILLALILVVAVFAFFCAKTFVANPKIVLPSLGLIPVAILVGWCLYKIKTNQVIATSIGLLFLCSLLILGNYFPIELGKKSLEIWMIVLFIYAFFASITPVNILLQPRDYLSSFLLLTGLILGYLGVFITHPKMNLPVFISWNPNSNPLWPMLMVTIACGAISGFHSLIASGTTSKQLPNEKYAKRIGYGAMLCEGILAVLALICVCGGIKNLDTLKEILNQGGPIQAFGRGFQALTPFLGNFGNLVAITVLNAFILTTLDTATRISRYITEELTGIKNHFISTLIVIIPAFWLCWGKKWKLIWPTFGASNQLVASLVLIIISCWLLLRNKSLKYTLIPAIFMLLTTTIALLRQVISYTKQNNWLLLITSLSMLILALYIPIQALKIFIKTRKEKLNF